MLPIEAAAIRSSTEFFADRHSEAGPEQSRYFTLTETYSSRHDHRMPALLFANKSGHCPYGHSLAPGMPQKISWMPCICAPAHEAESQGRGMGHLTLWCCPARVEQEMWALFAVYQAICKIIGIGAATAGVPPGTIRFPHVPAVAADTVAAFSLSRPTRARHVPAEDPRPWRLRPGPPGPGQPPQN